MTISSFDMGDIETRNTEVRTSDDRMFYFKWSKRSFPKERIYVQLQDSDKTFQIDTIFNYTYTLNEIGAWDKIQLIYKDSKITCYQTSWCIVYSYNSDELKAVVKTDYDSQYEVNNEFKEVYDIIQNTNTP